MSPTALVIPAAYNMSQKFGNSPDGFDSSRVFAALNDPKNGQMLSGVDLEHRDGLLIISRGTAIILLFVYVAYLVFQVAYVCQYPITKLTRYSAIVTHPRVFV